MTDIVDRLRQFQEVFRGPNFVKAYHDMGNEIGEAAEEIERLGAQVTALRAALREIEDSSNDPRAVREARAALGGKP